MSRPSGLQLRIQCLYQRFQFCVEESILVPEQELDRLPDILLGLGAEALIQEQPVLLTGVEEFTNAFNAHLFPDRGDLLRTQTFDLQHCDDARRGL